MNLPNTRIISYAALIVLVVIIAVVLQTTGVVSFDSLGGSAVSGGPVPASSQSAQGAKPLDKVTTADSGHAVSSHGSGSQTIATLSWQNALTERRTGWYLKQLAISASPNDWYRAVSLAKFCAGSLAMPAAELSKAIKDEKVPAKRENDILSLHAEAQERCLDGEAEWSPPPMLNGLLRRSRESGSELALAPVLSEKTSKLGLTDGEAHALKSLLSDTTTRSAWVAENSIELGTAMRSTVTFSALNSAEVQAVIFQSLCLSGDDCGQDSLYRGLLCSASAYAICGVNNVASSVADAFDSAKAQRIVGLAEQLRAAMNNGNLSAIGLIR